MTQESARDFLGASCRNQAQAEVTSFRQVSEAGLHARKLIQSSAAAVILAKEHSAESESHFVR
jgi:hypothetical protein